MNKYPQKFNGMKAALRSGRHSTCCYRADGSPKMWYDSPEAVYAMSERIESRIARGGSYKKKVEKVEAYECLQHSGRWHARRTH